MVRVYCLAFVALISTPSAAQVGNSFVNWESPHVTPLDLTPDGGQLLAVNTADNRLEIFDLGTGFPIHAGSVPVGLDPVSVRARTNTEAWVVNHVSDSISIVDLGARNVISTIYPGDEPADVVFAGTPQRAFVSVSQLNQVLVYDPQNLGGAPALLSIEGEDPRALATDGTMVYVAIFESGNRTTALSEFAVSFPAYNPYAGDLNPPPNSGATFLPPLAPGLPTPPAASLIVKKAADGSWRDINQADWSAAVSWDLHDHDVGMIDPNTLTVTYAAGSMNLNMALGARPGGGVTVVGTEASNHVRFEPNLRGTFVQVMGATIPGIGGLVDPVDLNPHLDYSVAQVPQNLRDLAIGDPRGVSWNADGSQGYITGMGSNNLLVVDSALNRTQLIEVGEGPTGVRVDEGRDRIYVLNKFDATISVIDAVASSELGRVEFFDPTPPAITEGRSFLYDTHRTSGLGQVSCASCHVDGRMDQLSWDLGDPQGQMKTLNQPCNDAFGSDCEDWHPVKGPMSTQTLIGIVGGTEPFHWRGDKENLAAFNAAFVALQGDDMELSDDEMARFTDFVASLTPPPNPYRQLDNTLASSFPNGGNPIVGELLFETGQLDGPFNCSDCHPRPFGTDNRITANELDSETQSIDTPHLMNLYEKTGFSQNSLSNNRGFGFVHDGSFDTLFNFLGFQFNFANDQQKLDVESFLMAYSTITHAGVGLQLTLPNSTGVAPATLGEMVNIATTGSIGLVARGQVAGEERSYYMLDSLTLQSDRVQEQVSIAALAAGAQIGQEVTFTLVPSETAIRIGADRDGDGFYDQDERDQGSDPADPGSVPPISFSHYCFGDGGDQGGCTDCPCNNNAPLGSFGGCLNSSGSSAVLLEMGTSSLVAANLQFEAFGLPGQVPAVLISGRALAPLASGNPCFGLGTGVTSLALDGLRCSVDSTVRQGVRASDASGVVGGATAAWGDPSGLQNSHGLIMGSTRYFQVFYRDVAHADCGTGLNTTQAIGVLFTP